jgi:hypothetical protein
MEALWACALQALPPATHEGPLSEIGGLCDSGQVFVMDCRKKLGVFALMPSKLKQLFSLNSASFLERTERAAFMQQSSKFSRADGIVS